MKGNFSPQDYPLSEKHPARLKTPSGLPFQEITLDRVLEGKIPMSDLRVTPAALELQAQLAEASGRPQLAENFRRAAELAGIPEDRIMAIYSALRPGRASPVELLGLAECLEREFQALRCAQLVREAAQAYFKIKPSENR